MSYAQNRLQQLSDPQGRRLSFDYDKAGHVRTVNGPQSTLHYGYDENGNLTEVTDTQGTRRYQYDEQHQLTGIIDRTGSGIATYTYDAQGRAIGSEHAGGVGRITLSYPAYAQGTAASIGETRLTNSLGQVTSYRTQRQHGLSLLLSGEGPGCTSCPPTGVTYTYDNTPTLTSRTEAGATLTYTYDALGRVTQLTRLVSPAPQRGQKPPAGEPLVHYTYEGESRYPVRIERPSVVAGKRHLTLLHYNDHHQLTQIEESGYAPAEQGPPIPLSRTTALAYDSNQRLVLLDGPRSDVDDRLQFAYDDQGHLTTLTLPEGQGLSLSDYDPSGRPRRMTRPGQSDTVLDYDAHGHLIRLARGEREVRYDYDAEGRLSGIDTPEGDHIRLQHDPAGRLTELNDHAGHRYTQLLDLDGQPQKSEWLNLGLLETVSYLYDAEGRLSGTQSPGGARHGVAKTEEGIQTTDPAGQTSLHRPATLGAVASLLPLGGLESFTDPRGLTTTTQRDDFGRVVRIESPDQGILRYTYDAAGLRLSQRDATGTEVRYRYNGLGQLIEKTTPEGVYTFAYANGQLTETTSPEGKESFTYTPDGQLASHTRELGSHRYTTAYRYEAGRLVEKTLPDGQALRYHHYPDGRLRAITRKELLTDTALIGEIEQSEAHQHWLYGNGLSRTLRYAKNGQAESLSLTPSLQFHYGFDADGHLTELIPEGHYAYDRLGRLTEANTLRGTFRYRYDASGNRVEKSDSGGTETTFAPEVQSNRLAPSNERGSQLLRGADQLSYNSEQRLTQVTRNGQAVADYRYNSFGERIQKTVYAGNNRRVTYYLYDGHHLSAEIDEAGQIVAQYLYLEQHPLAKLEGRTIYYLHTDHLGTPKLATDAAGQTVWAADYTPLGQAKITTAQITQNLRFPGQYFDAETGTHDNYHRTYDPESGRYLEADPIGLAGGDNLFAYLSGNPLGGSDPLGLAPAENIKLIGLPDKPVAEMSFGERLSVVLQSAEGAIADTDVKAALEELIGDIPGTVAIMAALTALQATPIGWFADIILVGAAWYAYGSDAVTFAQGLIALISGLNKADCSEADLKEATKGFLDMLNILAQNLRGPGKKLGDLIRKVVSETKGPSKKIRPEDKDPNKKKQTEDPDKKPVRPDALTRVRDFLKDRVNYFRGRLNSRFGGGGNIAVADIDIPGLPKELKSHSAIDELGDIDKKDKVLDKDWVFLRPENERVFKTFHMENSGEWDSEAKILEEVASRLKNTPNATGQIDLFTERPPCLSCKGALEQFHEMFPNITLRLHWDTNSLPKPLTPREVGSKEY